MHDPAVLRSMHLARFQAEPAIFVAPGRVNLIGEHTDYAEGFVMPAAIDFATLAAISPRTDGKIVIYSENYGEEKPSTLRPAHQSQQALERLSARRGFILAGEGHTIPGFSLSLWGDVPLGSGLSSSAALEVATALAVWAHRRQLSGPGARAPLPARENEFVGANCGIMDQFISANGQEITPCCSIAAISASARAHSPENVALVIANTMVKHSVAGGDYNHPPRRVEAACAVIASHRPGVRFLRDATVEDLEKWGHEMSPSRSSAPATSSAKTCAPSPPPRR
jgi:galactokinase